MGSLQQCSSKPSQTCRVFLQTPGWKSSRLAGRIMIGGNGFGLIARYLSSGEVFTALKPFFFAVHPDLFGLFPKERAVNEDSLKQLNAYIESASLQRAGQPHPTRLTFYLRQENGTKGKVVNPPLPKLDYSRNVKLQSIRIDLGESDVRRTVHSILEKCNLPTAYIDSLPRSKTESEDSLRNRMNAGNAGGMSPNTRTEYWGSYQDFTNAKRDVEQKKSNQDDLENWLGKNVKKAQEKLVECWPIRDEITRLRKSICEKVGVKDVIWDCGWGTRHCRGCLQSFQALASHHPESMEVLRGRTVIFGRETGVSLDGHVILNSGEVRANWHDAIKKVARYDQLILRIPSVEKALSRVLKDIDVVHRKFEPTRLAESYEVQIRKLTTSIGDYRGKKMFPKEWPEKLSHLELVVETDAGPLMVSPTGQIIVPSSCPPFLLVNFITDHMAEASQKLSAYKKHKYEERDLHAKCIQELELVALQKDDNVTPALMIHCCRNLLANAHSLQPLLRGSHLWITTYYSVLSDGEICIPWSWK